MNFGLGQHRTKGTKMDNLPKKEVGGTKGSAWQIHTDKPKAVAHTGQQLGQRQSSQIFQGQKGSEERSSGVPALGNTHTADILTWTITYL